MINTQQEIKVIGIYKITNPKGKVYIGQSTDIYGRWRRNYDSLNCKEQIKLYNSLKKYGPENHKFEVIELCSVDLLNEREVYFGELLEVLNPKKGLNLRLGNGNGSWGEEVRKKMSESHKGKKFTQKHKDNISKNKTGHACYTEERNIKIGKAQKGKPKPNSQVSVIQCDLQDNFIREFKSMTEAAKFLGLKHINGIEACCRGVLKTSNGFKWKRNEEK